MSKKRKYVRPQKMIAMKTNPSWTTCERFWSFLNFLVKRFLLEKHWKSKHIKLTPNDIFPYWSTLKDIRYMKLTWIFKNRINFVARWFPRIKAYTCKKISGTKHSLKYHWLKRCCDMWTLIFNSNLLLLTFPVLCI